MPEPAGDGGATVNHIGLCVTDLERSRRFYEEVLGFRHWWELTVPDAAASRLLQLPAPLGTQALYLTNDRFVLELIHYAEAGTEAARPRAMNDPGLTHLSVAVRDIPSVLDTVRPHGGDVLEETDMGGSAIMIRDPDGQLIELTTLQFPAMRPPWPGEPV